MAAKRCEICGMAVYCGEDDIVFGLKHTKGWTMRLICSKCLGDRKEFMKQYRKAVSKLMRLVRVTRNQWEKEAQFVPIGGGAFRYKEIGVLNEMDKPRFMKDWERAVAEDRGGQEVADCGGGC